MFIQHVINDALGAWHRLCLLLSPKLHGPQLVCSSSEGRHFVSTKCCFYRQSASRQREIPCRFWINVAVDVQIAWGLPLTNGWFIWNQFLSWLWTIQSGKIFYFRVHFSLSIFCVMSSSSFTWRCRHIVTPGYTYIQEIILMYNLQIYQCFTTTV